MIAVRGSARKYIYYSLTCRLVPCLEVGFGGGGGAFWCSFLRNCRPRPGRHAGALDGNPYGHLCPPLSSRPWRSVSFCCCKKRNGQFMWRKRLRKYIWSHEFWLCCFSFLFFSFLFSEVLFVLQRNRFGCPSSHKSAKHHSCEYIIMLCCCLSVLFICLWETLHCSIANNSTHHFLINILPSEHSDKFKVRKETEPSRKKL